MVSSKAEWVVRLGREYWQRHTYERADSSEFQLLGSVSGGLASGALAVTPQGDYIQVNGDYISSLPMSQLRNAVARAGKISPLGIVQGNGRADAPKPVITVKRRRVIVGA